MIVGCVVGFLSAGTVGSSLILVTGCVAGTSPRAVVLADLGCSLNCAAGAASIDTTGRQRAASSDSPGRS